MIRVLPEQTFPFELDLGVASVAANLRFRIEDTDDVVVLTETASGISEFASGQYRKLQAVPSTAAFYTVIWRRVSTGEEFTEQFEVTGALPAPFVPTPTAEPFYASADALRDKLGMSAEQLSDDEATAILTSAEDLIDARLGVIPVDPDTGRKIVLADWADEAWRLEKLSGATLEVAANLFRDPGIESRQRARSVSGDVTTSGVYGPAYGERAEALLNASGLRVNTARTRGGRKVTVLGRFV